MFAAPAVSSINTMLHPSPVVSLNHNPRFAAIPRFDLLKML